MITILQRAAGNGGREEGKEARPVSLTFLKDVRCILKINMSRLLLHGFWTAAENMCVCVLLKNSPHAHSFFTVLLVFLQSYRHTMMAFCHRLSNGANR